jgi:gamma-glutamyltranspeptidase / glutathione hydrolase
VTRLDRHGDINTARRLLQSAPTATLEAPNMPNRRDRESLPRAVCLLLVVAAVVAALAGPAPVRAQAPSLPPVTARHGLVACDHHLAAAVGARLLEQGGNAVDAAVATAFALAVVYPQAGNLGGGGFLVYHDAQGRATTYDFRETAPAAATERMFLDERGAVRDTSNHRGPLSVGVPGSVAGLWLAHQRHGRLPWAALVQPAIDLAQGGFPFSPNMRDWCDWLATTTDPLHAATRAAFLAGGTRALRPGEILKQPDLAATLERIRDRGADGFYTGATARQLAAWLHANGGMLTEADLAGYRALEREPVRGTYRGYDVVSMGPPSSGGVALIGMLNLLEGDDLVALGHNSAPYLHLLTEAMRRAYADRAAYVGDPEANPSLPLADLLSKERAARLRAGIDLHAASLSDSASVRDTYLPPESEQTTHLSVVDAAGGAVALTTTLEESYGSTLMAPGTGFLLNNEMGDFNAVPGLTDRRGNVGTAPNLVGPGRRMLSSMTPVILARGGVPVLVVGSPGGRTIINSVLQVVLNVVDFGLDIRQAIEAPRFHHQWLPDVTYFEAVGFPPEVRRDYAALGHPVKRRLPQGIVMGIEVDRESGWRYGAADSRSFDGGVAGY